VTGPSPTEPERRVLPFRPRSGLFVRGSAPPPVEDLGKYEHGSPESHDDYRHRMTMNVLAAAVVIVLILGGIWIADTMARMRKNQDCVLTGRSGCTPVSAPVNAR
jgi:hypothetical protein